MCLKNHLFAVVKNIWTKSEAYFSLVFFTNSESDKMYWWWTFLSILFCVLLTGHISMELYNQLQHLIDYVKNHTEAQQPDLMLGIYICEGDWIKKNKNIKILLIIKCD